MAIYKLSEIGTTKGGISNLLKSKYDKGINFVNYLDVYKNFIIDDETSLRKYDASVNDYKKYNVI